MALVRRLNSLLSRSMGLVVRNTVQYVGSNWKRLGSREEALKDRLQSRQSIHDAQLDRFQVQAPLRQVAQQAGPQIGLFTISHLQSQDLEAFVFFTHGPALRRSFAGPRAR